MGTKLKNKKEELIEAVGFRKHFQAEKWEDFNRQFFDGLAPKYDRLNEVLSLGQHMRYKKDLVRSANLKPGQKVLDLCTGSGDITLLIAAEHPEVEVVGLDASSKMLEIAKERTKQFPQISFTQGDVLNLVFEDNTFDVTVISFGLRNLANIEAGIEEMKRVTKKGGLILNLDLGRPENAFLEWVHKVYFRTFIPFLGKTIFHRGEFNSFAYLPKSGDYFPVQRELVEIFKKLGLSNVERKDYMLGSISQQKGVV